MKGKTALITGSSGGLGFAVAQELARAGCNVVLHGIEPEEGVRGRAAELAQAHGVVASYMQVDLTDAAATEKLVRDVHERHGGIDVLVNNAVTRHFAAIDAFPVECWDRALAVNLSAAFHTIRLSLPGMRARGWGRIFNMTSVYGSRGIANRVDYVTTKTALIGMTRAVAMETINQGITCNAICPGAVLTPTSELRIDALMEETGLSRERATQQFLQGKQPTHRFIDAAHVAQMLVFLCGPAGGEITGAVMPVEAGWLAS
ncbi:SDR family oxidoreductase [Variovorax sp. KK3]|uniref:SDR family oxidoreductase n=1 Tax=Variovorax sp. KK3 TaxID=1855728 RepID=UPI0009F881DE|nr:SDR family NAD(P)-dependent oxidoreductase [Variovorax sp. KK3]